MKYIILAAVLLLPALSCTVLAQEIDRCNIVWNNSSENSGGSMPCGGGDIGLNVWVEKGDLLFYFARSGSFDENNASLKGGRVRVRLSPNPLDGSLKGAAFKQELNLQDGSIRIEGASRGVQANIKVWVDVFRPVIHVEIKGNTPISAQAIYESWRSADRPCKGKENNGNSWKWAPKADIMTYKDEIGFHNKDILFYHRNKPGPTVFDATVTLEGLDSVKSQLFNPLRDLCFGGLLRGEGMQPAGTDTGKYLDTDFTGWTLSSVHPARSRRIDLYLYTAQTPTVAAWQTGLEQVIAEAKADDRTAWDKTARWWAAFWERSYIFIGADKTDKTRKMDNADPSAHSSPWQAGRNYQLFRYMLGCNAYGSYPTKFNGGLFTYDPSLVNPEFPYTPDFRNWGGGTMTAQNQRLVYFPMIKSGDFDMMKSQFDFYMRSLRNAELRTQVYWGHQGASFTEQIENYGLPDCSEYGWDRPEAFDKGVEYNAWLEYHWDTVLEFCLMMLETERYGGKDIHAYIPFIESCLRFFDEHYQWLAARRGRRSLDGDGHLILYPGSAGETYKMAYDAASTISGLHTILTRLLELPGSYLSDRERKDAGAMLNRLPPLPFRECQGHTTIAPARLWERINNVESMQLYPVFPWGIFGIGRPGLDTAINTWKYDTDAIRFRSSVGWKQDNIFAARLGLTDDAARLTVEKLKDGPRRFPAFWGPGFDWTPDHNWGGSGMIGLQEMLLQGVGTKIYLLPSWPRDWDVHFKLHAPYNTTVEAVLKNGKIGMLKVTPEERRKDIITSFEIE